MYWQLAVSLCQGSLLWINKSTLTTIRRTDVTNMKVSQFVHSVHTTEIIEALKMHTLQLIIVDKYDFSKIQRT